MIRLGEPNGEQTPETYFVQALTSTVIGNHLNVLMTKAAALKHLKMTPMLSESVTNKSCTNRSTESPTL